ncbi:MAG: bifunctional diguanylate cyclase/phosphodiesterase [Rhodospirillales bacterium]|nr:bifunctional diguanylate cyclase/phosphodiesterase [Rhodospirillales bacterium]
MIEVRSGLEADTVLTSEIKAASAKDSLARVAAEIPYAFLRLSHRGHMLYANAPAASLARQARIKLGDQVPKQWRTHLKQCLDQTDPVSADWAIEGKFYRLKFVNVPDSKYVSLSVHDTSEDYREEYRDPLTGLANRVLFLDRLRQFVSLSLRNQNWAAVHVIRLQHFKEFSQTLGHGTADNYLCKLAERLLSAVRTSDTVARISYNEFAIIQVEPNGIDGVETTAKKLQTAIDSPIIIAGERLLCRSFIGISTFPNDADTPDDLLRNALLALENDFKLNEKSYRFFIQPMREKMDRRWAVEDDLERAIQAEEFTLCFQPKQELDSGRLSGMEALVRWKHPKHGEILPDEFIPVAERSRLILPLGNWILRTACEQAKRFNALGAGDLKVAVNLSALQFKDQGIIDTVRRALHESGLSPDLLELEITESIAMHDAITANDTFRKLADLGVSMSIDDFGTGYSSLAYLKNFAVQRIKIDKLFIDDIGTESGAGSIARAITTMGHSFGMVVTAEGVGTEEQVAFLRRLECDEIQGDYYSPPLSSAAFEAFVRDYKPPHHYEQGVLNWSDFRDLGNSLPKSNAPGNRKSIKDERRGQS